MKQINSDLNSNKIQITKKNVNLEPSLNELIEHKFFGTIVSKYSNIASEKLKSKVLEILKTINTDKINFYKIRRFIFEGLPDDIPSLRSLSWKLLFNYLPLDVNNWEEAIDKRRSEYNKEKKELFEKLELEIILKKKNEGNTKKENQRKNSELAEHEEQQNNNSENSEKKLSFSGVSSTTVSENKPKINIKKKNTTDHPLSQTQNSKWKSYFEDLELLEEIEKDVRRTRTHMHFFFMPAKSNIFPISNEKITELADRKRNDPGSDRLLSRGPFETNADVMCRILFIYGKKNPHIRYVQGMNEVLAPIFYAFSNDQNPYFYLNLEADSYICFESLMNEIQDIFIRSKDNTETGIQTRIKSLNLILKVLDREIHDHLKEEKVELQYFAFRWYTLFLTQEFEMPDILRIWDSILADDNKFEFLNMICLAIIKIKRNELLQSDFSGIMLTMQNLEKLDVEKLLQTAEAIRNELHRNSD
jgi:hypothetical protein